MDSSDIINTIAAIVANGVILEVEAIEDGEREYAEETEELFQLMSVERTDDGVILTNKEKGLRFKVTVEAVPL